MEKDPKPRQLWLSQAHEGGYLGYWKIEEQERKSLSKDPEGSFAILHDNRERQRLINSVVSKEWRELLKSWGYTTKAIKEKQRASFKRAIEDLKRRGIWEEIIESSSTTELLVTLKIVKGTDSKRIDLDSSEGFSIYPNELSWWQDIHGSIPSREMEKIRQEMKDQLKQLTR